MRNLSPITSRAGNPASTSPNPQRAEPILESVSQHEGLYSLNDLHRLSGGNPKDRPQLFLRTQKAKELLAELETQQKYVAHNCTPYICIVKGKGQVQGTFACEEIACSYAMWISAKFHLVVIRAFLRLNTYTQRVNVQQRSINTLETHVSGCGRDLSVHGKQTLPKMRNELALLLDEQQLKLELGGQATQNPFIGFDNSPVIQVINGGNA